MMTELSRRWFLGGSIAGLVAHSAGAAQPVADGGSFVPPRYGPAPGVAKLNANENPYGPSPRALREMGEACRLGAYYVDDSVRRLKAMIAERHGLGSEQIAISPGSSGVLVYAAAAAARTGQILTPELFWDTTVRRGTRHAGGIRRVPMTAELGIDLSAMAAAVGPGISMVHITNPNNPTGHCLDPAALRDFCRRVSGQATVLVDEAYNEITEAPERHSMVDLVREGLDVIVARTFSKIYGLAGLRVGYAMASPENIARIERQALGDYTLNQAGLAAAVASYEDEAFLALSRSRIVEGREMILDGLRQVGLTAVPSAANFLFVDLASLDADAFQARMAARNVLVRGVYREYNHHSRVSMGRLEDVARYVQALPAVLEELNA